MSFSASVAHLVERSQSKLVSAAPWWKRVPLGDVAKILNGAPWKSAHFNDQRGVPIVRIRDVTSGATATRYAGPVEDGYWIDDGDLLVGMDGDFISRIWSAGRALLNQRVCRISPNEEVYLKSFLAIALPGYLQLINDETHSVTVKHLSSKTLAEIPLPLPTPSEQRRIVTKIDSLSAKSKRCRDQLDHVPRLVEKYKQAILAAAFRGDLTQDWRLRHSDESTPKTRLDALHAERENLFGALLPRKPRANENGRISVNLRDLPDRWARTTLEAISNPKRVIQYGILKPGPHIDGGVPYVKVMNIKGGRVELGSIRSTTPEIAHQYRRATILTGDILLTIRGTVGRLAIVPTELDGGNITQDSVRIALLESVEREFVFWYLHCPAVQQYFVRNQKGVAVRGINVGDVRPLEIPLPARGEQREIVRRIAAAFSWIDRLSSETHSARKLIDNLEQAILAKAFQGELVPQDPSDEPASVLLERIRAERKARLASVRGKKGKLSEA